MHAFAAKLGIADIEVRDGTCSLEIDGIPVEILETPDGSHLVASAAIGTPPLEKTEDFLRMILEANVELFGRSSIVFGKLPGESDLVLQWQLPAQGIDLESFCTKLEAFMNNVEQWRRVLEDFGSATDEVAIMEEEASVLSSSASDAIYGDLSGFMQV